MGFGALFKQQDQLTSLSNSASISAGQAQKSSADLEASALTAQGALANAQAQENAALTKREGEIAAGTQAEQYASSGVNLVGTPKGVIDETLNLATLAADAQTQQGALEQDLMRAKAVQAENQGNQADLMGGIGADINSLTNQIGQTTTQDNFFNGIFTGLAGGTLSILKGLV